NRPRGDDLQLRSGETGIGGHPGHDFVRQVDDHGPGSLRCRRGGPDARRHDGRARLLPLSVGDADGLLDRLGLLEDAEHEVGDVGRPAEGTVPIGAALTTTMRRTSVACIARTMARVPREAMPASEFDRGPRPERTASAPSTADSSTAGSGAARSAVTTRTCPD